VQGTPADARAINKEGLKRRGFTPEEIEPIEDAFKLIYRSGKVMAEVRAELAVLGESSPHVKLMSEFINSGKRPLARG